MKIDFFIFRESLLVWNQVVIFCNSSFISSINVSKSVIDFRHHHEIDWCPQQNSTGFKTVDTFTISFIYNIKSNGPNIDPCETPHIIFI